MDPRSVVPASPNVHVNIVPSDGAPNILVRIVWYLFIGWWLGGLVITTAYLLLPWVITTPASFWLFNRIGSAMTLRPRRRQWDYAATEQGYQVMQRQTPQHAWYVRAVWFLLIGWWLGAAWLVLAYALCLLIITMPLGIMMIDRSPGVITLQRN